MDVVIAQPIINTNNINISYDPKYIELNYHESNIKYYIKVLEKDIPIVGFNIKVFYHLLTDIINKKHNSTLNINNKDKKCYIHFSMTLDDYIKTEYKFVLILHPIDEMNLLKNENKIMKEEITELNKEVKTLHSENKSIKEEITELNKEVKTLHSENKSIKEEIIVSNNNNLLPDRDKAVDTLTASPSSSDNPLPYTHLIGECVRLLGQIRDTQAVLVMSNDGNGGEWYSPGGKRHDSGISAALADNELDGWNLKSHMKNKGVY